MGICIYDTHGDPCFKSEVIKFESWAELVDYVGNDIQLQDRIMNNWAIIRHEPFSEGQMVEALILMAKIFSERPSSEQKN